MKRFRLSAKLAMAILPIGLVALSAAGFIAVSFLGESKEQNETAHAATVSADAIATLKAVWEEEGQARQLNLFEDEGARATTWSMPRNGLIKPTKVGKSL